jgi:hypothetical protein
VLFEDGLEGRGAGVVGVALPLVVESVEVEEFEDLGLVEGAFDGPAVSLRGVRATVVTGIASTIVMSAGVRVTERWRSTPRYSGP